MSEPHRSIAPRQSLSLLACVILAVSLHPTELQGQRNRDSWQRVADVIAALAIAEGSYVADIGAGDGYFTEHLAAEVGATGRVFAVDISEQALSSLRRLVENESLNNVEVVTGDFDDPKLADESVDAVLVVNAYHEMTEYEAMLAGMLAALKPGGRLVMLDHVPSDPSESRGEQTRDHDLSIDIVERELQAAGFQIVGRYELFAERGRTNQWMLVARR